MRASEMEKVGDTGDISLLFVLAGANFWAILGHFWAILGHFWPFWVIFGHFWSFSAILGHFCGCKPTNEFIQKFS